MKPRKLLIAGSLAGLMVMAAAAPAEANIAWCVYDPPVKALSPQGSNLVVNNYYYVAPADRRLAASITSDTTTAPNALGGTLITVHVYVPAGIGHLHVVAVSQRYRTSTTGDGIGGTVITMYLDVPND